MSIATEDVLPDIGRADLSDHYRAPEVEWTDRQFGTLDSFGRWTPAVPEGIEHDKDEAPLRAGDDGDDYGTPRDSQEVADMVASGHGFLVREVTRRVERSTACEVCGEPLPGPSDAGTDWLCQFDDSLRTPASLTCNCNWCRSYQAYIRGEYRPRGGRPAKRCGSAECKRIAARDRQRKRRAAMRGEPAPAPQRVPRRVWRDGTVPRALPASAEGHCSRW